MDSFGRYVLQYQPGNDDTEYLQVGIQMNISAEATLADMTAFFDSFLKAAGYYYDGELQIVEDKPKQKTYEICEPASPTARINWENSQDFWDEDGHSLTGNPWIATVGSGMLGGLGEDHLCLKTSFGNNVVTF